MIRQLLRIIYISYPINPEYSFWEVLVIKNYIILHLSSDLVETGKKNQFGILDMQARVV